MNNEENKITPVMEFQEIYTALARAQAELSNPEKKAQGYGYKYSTLDQIIEILREILPRHGLSYTQNLQQGYEKDANFVSVETIIFHSSGQRLQPSFFSMPVEAGKMSLAQAYGATITYARRYALSAVFGLASESDTDGHVEKKTKNRHEPQVTTQERVAIRLKAMGAEEYAASRGIDPSKASGKTLQAILDLTDDQIKAKVAEFNKEQEEEAAA